MSKFRLQQDVFTQATRIPNCFIEKYMPKAAGEFVKIYIYLLKCVEENRSELSIARIADALEDSEKDVIRALKYWEKKGLLKLTFEDGTLTSLKMSSFAEMSDETEKITVNVSRKAAPAPSEIAETAAEIPEPVNQSPEPAAQAPKAEPLPVSASEPSAPLKKQYTPQEIEGFSKKDEITLLLYSIQKYMGQALTGADLNTVLYFYDKLGMQADTIEYLFEYCVSKGHRNMRYIEKTALAWADEGIKTLKAAKTKNSIFSDNCYPVLRAFGLTGRTPTKGEADFVSKWTVSYGFSREMILEACSRTMNAIHQPSFEYTDSILRRWKAAGVSTKEELAVLDEKHEKTMAEASRSAGKKNKGSSSGEKTGSSSNKFNNFDQRTYDYLELEEKLFNV